MGNKNPPRIPLPKSWTQHVRIAMLHVVARAGHATAYTQSWAANSLSVRVRLKAENERLQEEIRIKNVRMVLITPQRRPHYPPMERMSILECGPPVDGHSSKPPMCFW